MLNESDLEELIFIKKINESHNIEYNINNKYCSLSESTTDDEESSDSNFFDKKFLTQNTTVYIAVCTDKLDYLYEGDIVTFSKDIYVYSTNKMSKTMKKIANGNPLQIMFNIFLKKGMKLYCDGNTIIFPYKTVFIIKRGRLLGYEGSSVMSYNVNLGGFCF
tara:strand:+ start:196 stop:681 length:486 start_codon:yes stop_codon:yes gene_type:complete